MGNRVLHFEVGSNDDAALKRFYADLFGWGLSDLDGGYTVVDTRGGDGVNGGITGSGDGSNWVCFYVGVDDLQATLDRAESMGGRTVTPPTEIPGMLTWAMLADPDGYLVGLVKAEPPSGGSAPGPSGGDGAAVDWFEVLGSDAERTQRFYCDLFGWTLNEPGFPGYRLVDTGAGPDAVGGGLGASSEGNRWATVYAHVPDVEQTLARAESLGGSRIYGPNPVDDHMQTGALRDPAGNVFGVYEHSH